MKLTDLAAPRCHRVEVPASIIPLIKLMDFLSLEKRYVNNNNGIIYDRKNGSSSITYSTEWEPITAEHSYVDESGEAQGFEYLVDHEINESELKRNRQKTMFIFAFMRALNISGKVLLSNDVREDSEIERSIYINSESVKSFLSNLRGQEALWASEWYNENCLNENGLILCKTITKNYIEEDFVYENIKDLNTFEEFEQFKKESFLNKLTSGKLFRLDSVWEHENQQITDHFKDLEEVIKNVSLVMSTFGVGFLKKESIEALNVKAFAQLFNKEVFGCCLGTDFLEKNELFKLTKLRFSPEKIHLEKHLTSNGFVNYLKYLSEQSFGFGTKDNNTKDVLETVKWIKEGIGNFDFSVKQKTEIKSIQKEMGVKINKLVSSAVNSGLFSEEESALMEVLSLQVSLLIEELNGEKKDISSSLMRL